MMVRNSQRLRTKMPSKVQEMPLKIKQEEPKRKREILEDREGGVEVKTNLSVTECFIADVLTDVILK